MNHYLDAAAFTRLFAQRHKNFPKICLGMQAIVENVARRFSYDSIDDRHECTSAVLFLMIERIDRFDRTRGTDAFSYYTSVAWRGITDYFRKSRRRRVRSFTDVTSDFVGGRGCFVLPGAMDTDRDNYRGASFLDVAKPYALAG